MSNESATAHAPAILTIDLAALCANWRLLRARVAPAATSTAVVKADAYGLGAAMVAPALVHAGCRSFWVAQLGEALALRAILPEAEVLLLGGVPPGAAPELAAARIIPVLNHLGEIELWSRFCSETNRPHAAVIHLDTGMNRLGLGPDEQARLIAAPERLQGITLRAWMSHFACADDPAHPLNVQQIHQFHGLCARLPPAPRSLANSSGIFLEPSAWGDLVRPGCALYGVNPTPARTNPMQPVIRLEARVLQVRRVDSGMTVGYGASHRVCAPGQIITLGLGYADGYLRALSGCGHVYCAGVALPVVGRVSMDLITVDASAVAETAVQPGQLLEVIGTQRPVDQVAAEAGTIGYEILTDLGRRYQRVYRGGMDTDA